MEGCEEQLILVFSHNGLGGPEAYFNQEHVQRFARLSERIASLETGKRIVNFAGHHHVLPRALIKELSPHYTFVNGVAMIAGVQSYLHVIEINADGVWHLDYPEVNGGVIL